VGDVNADDVYALAKKFFGPLKREDITPPANRPEVPQLGIKRVTVKRPAEVARLWMAYKAPGLASTLAQESQIEGWEPYALEVLSGILSGGNSARFPSRLVRGLEVAVSVGSSYQLAGRLDGLFSIRGTPAQGMSVSDLEAAIRAQIVELKNERVSEEELQRIKAQVVSSDVYERDSAFYQGMILGTFETVGLGWRTAEEYVDRISSISAEQVQAVARKYLIDDTATVAVLEPLPMNGNDQGQ
jgi:zinc protease